MNKVNNDGKHRLVTRRVLAWGITGTGIFSLSFLAIWGACTRQGELVALSAGALISLVSSVAAFYFAENKEKE